MAKGGKKEVRKIQMTGGSTYTVSLPKKWIEKRNLKTGDGMVMEEQASSILLSPAKYRDEKKYREYRLEIGSDDNPDSVNRKILSLYLVGYNRIVVKSSEERLRSAHKQAIKEFVRDKLVGTEIISETIEDITLQTLLSYSELSVKGALKRMYRVASSMHENAMTALGENNQELASDIVELDDEVDRFQMYLIREIKACIRNPSLLKKVGLNSLKEALSYRLVSNSVERVGDHAALIASNVIEMKGKIGTVPFEKLDKLHSLAKEIFEKSIDSLYERNYDLAEEVIKKLKDVRSMEREINRYLTEKDVEDSIRIRLILESIRRIAEYSGDVSEIVLNFTITEEERT